jgi:hypothetical protein
VKRAVLLLCIMALTTGCETSTDPLDGIISGGGGAITPAQASGSWTFTLQRTSTFPCSGALANGQGIAAFINVGTDGTLAGTSSWQNPISGAVEPLSGTVGLSNGALRLTFGTNGGGAMELTSGTMTSGGTVTTAAITDPGAGFSQVFGSDACQYSASAIKTG